MTASTTRGVWVKERDSWSRAFGGAFLFGVPLLFTMEMWWIGEYLARPRLGGFLALGLVVNTALAYFTGFRDQRRSLLRACCEAVEALGIGIIAAAVVLLVLGRISPGDPLNGITGMLVIQAIPLSLGASVANAVFRGDSGRELSEESTASSDLAELANDMLATFAGATFLGFAIAPTEEIPMLAVGLGGAHLVGLVVLTLVVTYVIVFASGFDPSHRGDGVGGYFQGPFSETVLAYLVALGAAAMLLLGFGQIGSGGPALTMLTEIVVLGMPAAIGGAAGRVVV